MIKAGIVGSSGYVAGELMRILVNHPEVEIDFLYSHSNAGQPASSIHEDLFAYTDLVFSDKVNPDVDVLFLSLGHGNSSKFLSNHSFSPGTKIIDLSNDFRLEKDAVFEGKTFVYGLPELQKSKIQNAQYIANPGCFATAIQLAILPLAKAGIINDELHVNAITGSTGAGQSLSTTTHFSWRNNNISIYKAFRHQHLGEINESIASLQSNYHGKLNFLPLRGDFTRGIHASVYTKTDMPEDTIVQRYTDFYQEATFTHVSTETINMKQVVNTNNALLQVQKIDDKVLVTSVIDNLVKGAAGQAIHNMNLMFGFEETSGLKLKANYF